MCGLNKIQFKVDRCVAPGLNAHLLALGYIFAAFDACEPIISLKKKKNFFFS